MRATERNTHFIILSWKPTPALAEGRLVWEMYCRTAGLTFSIVRGPRILGDDSDGEWIAVALYGNMGAPIKGFEHEVMGLGINPI